MSAWRWLLLLLLLALAAALGWHWLASDPGYVLLRWRGWQLETTVIAGAALVLLGWALLTVLWRALRWPFGALSRRHRRISRKRFSEGLIALIEGRHGEAERALARAARYPPLRAVALLVEAEAAWRRGEHERALEALDEATQHAPRAARVLRARVLRREGRAQEALALLVPEAETQRLAPAGWMELAEAALAAGRLDRARAALDPLRASGTLSPRAYATFEARVLAAALEDASGAAALNALWSGLARGQRYAPGVVVAYARRAAVCGAGLAAQDEIETALASSWSPALVLAYADLDDGTLDARRRRAEQWLETHPNDASLLIALGRMAVRQQQWSRARDWLERAVALEPSSLGWESLGDTHAGLGDVTRAATCYRNALRLARGESTDALAGRGGRMDTRPIAVEERSELGVPRLPGGSPAPR